MKKQIEKKTKLKTQKTLEIKLHFKFLITSPSSEELTAADAFECHQTKKTVIVRSYNLEYYFGSFWINVQYFLLFFIF